MSYREQRESGFQYSADSASKRQKKPMCSLMAKCLCSIILLLALSTGILVLYVFGAFDDLFGRLFMNCQNGQVMNKFSCYEFNTSPVYVSVGQKINSIPQGCPPILDKSGTNKYIHQLAPSCNVFLYLI
jgi:hypothetical protein